MRLELLAGVDAEFAEGLAQVPFDRAWADEEAGAGLQVGEAFPDQPDDLDLLGGAGR